MHLGWIRDSAIALGGFVALYLLFFGPVLLSGNLMAPGDGANNYLPALVRDWSLWTDQILAGYPAFADPQFLSWYPLRIFGHHYNALLVSAYVIAAFCSFGYARLITGSVLAGVVAGIVYGCSGFMLAHLGHLTIVHSAAWVPLILWGLEWVARTRSWRSCIVVAMGVALSGLGGHPQPWIYGLTVGVAYVLWRGINLHGARFTLNRRFAWLAAVAMATGLMLTAVQTVPLAEFSRLTVRSDWTFADFITLSLPANHLLLMLFPNILGNRLGYAPYIGDGSLTELAFYAGVVSLLLAWIALWHRGLRGLVVFWCGVAAIAILFMLGDATPFGRIAFNMPVISHFRAPARAGMVFALAISILAAIGVEAICSRKWPFAKSFRRVSLGAVPFILAIAFLALRYETLSSFALAHGVVVPSIWRNTAVVLPVLLAVSAAAVILWLASGRWRHAAAIALIVLVVGDMASFGWFTEWRANVVDAAEIQASPEWARFLQAAGRDHARILSFDGAASPSGPARPNMNLMFDLPSASGYGPLLPSRYAMLTGVDPNGQFGILPADSPLWQLLDVRWAVSTNANRQAVLGSGCHSNGIATEVRLMLPRPQEVAAVRLESQMACSVAIPDDTVVAQVNVNDDDQPSATVLAGRDTAEWAWEAPRVRGIIRHRRAPVAKRDPSLWFRAEIPFAEARAGVRSITVRAMLPRDATLRLGRVSVIGQDGAATDLPLLSSVYADSEDWIDAPVPGFAFAKAFVRPLSRAWLVGGISRLADEQALIALRTGHAPDGTRFSPTRTVILSDQVDSAGGSDGPAGTVGIERISADHWRFRTHALTPAHMVISQIDYPGWVAAVDGIETPIKRADFAFQAISVPAGDSVVELRFRPRSVLIGGVVSVLGLAMLFLFASRWMNSRRKQIS